MIIETTITDITDPNTYCSDEHAYINTYLHTKFVGKCFMGMFITNISRIVKFSQCIIDHSTNSGACLVYVTFEVEGTRYHKGDILPAVKLMKDTDGIIRGMYEGHLIFSLVKHPLLDFNINPGVPCYATVIIDRVLHEPMKTVNATVTLLTRDNITEPTKIFKAVGTLTEGVKEKILVLQENIRTELAIRSASYKEDERYYKINDYGYYDYKVETSSTKIGEWVGLMASPSTYNEVSLLGDFACNGYWSRPGNIHKSCPVAVYSKTPITMPNSVVVTEPIDVVMINMLSTVYKYLKCINATVKVMHDTGDRFELYWKTINRMPQHVK